MDIARPEFKTQKRRRQLFLLAAVILGVAAASVGVSRLKPAAPTVERGTEQIRIEVRNAQWALEQSRARVESALNGRDLAERTFEITKKEPDLGAGSSYQTMTAQRDLSVAEPDLFTARTIYAKARVELDRAAGATLERNGVLIQDAITGTVTALPPQLMPSSAKPQDPCSVVPSGVERATVHEVDK
jgi:hypothetical protein